MAFCVHFCLLISSVSLCSSATLFYIQSPDVDVYIKSENMM